MLTSSRVMNAATCPTVSARHRPGQAGPSAGRPPAGGPRAAATCLLVVVVIRVRFADRAPPVCPASGQRRSRKPGLPAWPPAATPRAGQVAGWGSPASSWRRRAMVAWTRRAIVGRSRGNQAPSHRPGDGGGRPRPAVLVTLSVYIVTLGDLLAVFSKST